MSSLKRTRIGPRTRLATDALPVPADAPTERAAAVSPPANGSDLSPVPSHTDSPSPARSSVPASRGAEAPASTKARREPLVVVLAATAAGIIVDWELNVPLAAAWAASALFLVAWCFAWRRRAMQTAGLALLAAVAMLAAASHHATWRLFPASELGRDAAPLEQPLAARAYVLAAPRAAPRSAPNPLQVLTGEQSLVPLEIVAVRNRDRWQPASGRARLTIAGPPPALEAGDRIEVFARFAAPPRPLNPGENDYAQFLRGDRVLSLLDAESGACLRRIARGSAFNPWAQLDTIRQAAQARLERLLSPRNAALAGVLLLGEREDFEPQRNQAFLKTGTVHMLSISGMHVGLLALFLTVIVRRMPLPATSSAILVALLIIAYMFLVDARPPVVRATVVVALAAVAAIRQRPMASMNLLAAAALVVLAINPAELFRVGAQLSFLSAAGLICVARLRPAQRRQTDPLEAFVARFEPRLRRWRRQFLAGVGRVTELGFVIWLLTLPLVLARFHLLAPAAVVLNTLLWLPVGTALVSGFATVLLGAIWLPLGRIAAAICDVSLASIDFAVERCARLPGSHFYLPGPPDWWLLSLYGAIAVYLALPRRRPPRRWVAAMAGLWVAIGFAPYWLAGRPDELRCSFLSVGHGCSVLIETPARQTILYDAGRLGAPHRAAESISAALWSRGIVHLDAVVLSHPDTDHYNALPELLERFSVGAVYVSPIMFERPQAALQFLKHSIDAAHVPLREIRAGDRLRTRGTCCIEVLHPPRHGILGTDNANSIVLSVEYAGRRALLTGDLEGPGLADLMAEEPRACDVLLVPHHGSRASNPAGLIAWAHPAAVVVSGSNRFDSSQMESEYAAAGARVWHTARAGAILFRLESHGCATEPLLAANPLHAAGQPHTGD